MTTIAQEHGRDIEWWGSEGLKRGGGSREEQADSVYRGGEWLEGVSGRVVASPPLVERTAGTVTARIPDIVSGVVMNYSLLQVNMMFVGTCSTRQLDIPASIHLLLQTPVVMYSYSILLLLYTYSNVPNSYCSTLKLDTPTSIHLMFHTPTVVYSSSILLLLYCTTTIGTVPYF